MKHTRRPVLRIVASLLLPAILSSTLPAAETVHWADLPKKVGKGKLLADGREDREYTIVTATGETFRGRTPIFSSSAVNFNASGPSVPREQVTEIRIRHRVPWSEAFALPAGMLVEKIDPTGGLIFLTPPGLLLIPVLVGTIAATAPFVAVIEGGRRLAPDKVLRVQP